MRLALFAASALAALVASPFAAGDTPKRPEFQVHEIGYLDLNRPDTVRGWLQTIPKWTPMQSQAMWASDTEWRDGTPPPRSTPRDPALFFYANRAMTVNVRVGFRSGAPVAWWPAGTPAGRFLRFNSIRLLPKARKPSSKVLNTSRYPGLAPLKHLRDVGATPVKMNNRTEGGLVYEGVLPFNPKLSVRQLRKDGYEVTNDSRWTLYDVILIPAGEREKGYLIGTMKPGARYWITLGHVEKAPLAPMLDLHLTRTGLFAKEAQALRKCVLSADFVLNPGPRLVARVSREVWDQHFPMTITPRPQQLLRVGVIRLFDAASYRAVQLAEIDLANIKRRGEQRERKPMPSRPGTAGAR